jgi:hypothetical protein
VTRVAAHGLSLDAPLGWDVRIYKRAPDDEPVTTHPVMHAGNFALPEERGDYGSGAVEIMGPANVFFALLEFHPDSVRTAMFSTRGLRLPLLAGQFDPQRMQRNIPGQSGLQRFFQVDGRAFCLYVVIGSHLGRAALAPVASDAVRSLLVTNSGGVYRSAVAVGAEAGP